MTPKEKADYFVMKFKSSESQDGYNDVRDIHAAIRCALIAVGEIIKSNPIFVTSKLEGKDGMHEAYLYWKKVKEELEKL
jgi:hypothetical protein